MPALKLPSGSSFPVALLTGLLLLTSCHASSAQSACTPKADFVDKPHPPIAPVEQLVRHTEEITIERPLEHVLEIVSKTKLENAIAKTRALPSVAATHTLTNGEFGVVGSRRLACLTDGSTLEEEILANDRSPTVARFRYVVWNYTSKVARPVSYAVGDFERTALPGNRTRVRWTYAFQLNRGRFPGYLGSLGDFLFRKAFLDRQYADMMRATLLNGKVEAECAP
jgi:Polyketide cyclase / dehydrase and lipid transport